MADLSIALRAAWVALVLALVLAGAQALAGVYKWVDDKGVVHYSEHPPAGRQPSAPVKEMTGVQVRVSGATAAACAALRNLVPRLMTDVRGRQSREEARERASEADQDLRRIGMDDANLRKLIDMLYNFRDPTQQGYRLSGSTYYSDQLGFEEMQRAQNEVHSRCLAGAFGTFDAGARQSAFGNGSGQQARGRQGESSGTGFFVASGLVATSLHVVDGGGRISVIMSDGRLGSATVVARDADHDLALLSVLGSGFHRILATAPAQCGLGAPVFTLGFPQIDIMGTQPKLSTGVISALSGIRDDPRTYQISVPVQAGNSGGPLLDAHGQVVGVVASKLNAAQVFRWTGDLPQNVNYAVKSVHLQQLMSRVESQGEAPETVTGEGVEALAPLVQSALVRVSVKY